MNMLLGFIIVALLMGSPLWIALIIYTIEYFRGR